MTLSELFPWIIFGFIVLVMLIIDLGIANRRPHEIKLKEAIVWSLVWIGLALLFNGGVYLYLGPQKALEFFTGWLIEKSLSVDNLFVFLLIFSFFKVETRYQHKVLFWGIIGALIMRAIFIAAGVSLVREFHWIMYVFGAFLIFTGGRMAFNPKKEIHPEKNPLLKLLRRFLPVLNRYEGGKFFTRIDGRAYATPLFVVLIVVETTDLIFAVDSIPAILAITLDPFIVFTSNVFAILGLRALYFALAGVIDRFRYLHYGLAAVLVFIGIKMVIEFFEIAIPTTIALAVVGSLLGIAVMASLFKPRAETGV